MKYAAATQILHQNHATWEEFAKVVGKTTRNIRDISQRNNGNLPPLYETALHGFMAERKRKKA